MQTSSRHRDYAGGQRGRHGAQISISDDSHHVTDAISSLYDYAEQQTYQQQPQSSPQSQSQHQQQQNRPLSFLPSAPEEIIQARRSDRNPDDALRGKIVGRSKTFDHKTAASSYANRESIVGRSNSVPHQHALPSPPLSAGLRSPADTATASFPLNDIDYESSPAAVAQELSNLQAIRRMSMNVDSAGDPDLPTFGVPPSSPTGTEDEDDTARLFWVPARLHPELAPTEFKTFFDKKIETIKRRSGDFSLSPDGLSRSSSSSSLSRKKSMLSRQIHTDARGADTYQDGAERLERKRSASNQSAKMGMSNLHALEEMVNDPSRAIERLKLDTNLENDASVDDDMPILPPAPGGNTLRRSTRTTYRKGSLRRGERVPPSKRAARAGAAESDAEEVSSPISAGSEAPLMPIQRVQTEPIPVVEKSEKPAENFSRPSRGPRRVVSPPPTNNTAAPDVSFDSIIPQNQAHAGPPARLDSKSPPPASQVPSVTTLPPATSREPKPFVSQIASGGRSTVKIPSIVETPPQHEDSRSILQQTYRSELTHDIRNQQQQPPQQQQRAGKRVPGRAGDKPDQTLQHMASHPSPLPGHSSRTDSLSFIPTYSEERRVEPKPESKKEKEGTKKSSWSWGSLLGSEEKEKDKRKDEESKESKKSKLKIGKANDNTRLDVLQQTMEGSRGRESLVLDRNEIRLEEERKRESGRKSSESKKEKDGLFSSLFGGSKKKPERESLSKKAARALSPEPPRPVLKPDIDYNWTRFSILEERAIYRMAHIKLANPRRPLYSQVLLSNFMYSYLAKVQQMHPQMQIPQTAAAKAQQRAQQQKKADQPEEFSQYQRYQEQQEREQRAQQQPASQVQNSRNGSSNYVEDHQNYNYDAGDDRNSGHAEYEDSQYGQQQPAQNYGYQSPQQHSSYSFQQHQFDEPDRKSDDDMW